MVEDGIPGEAGEKVEYHSCPNLFIPVSCRGWHEIFIWREREFPHTMPDITAVGERYMNFRRYFLSVLHEFEGMMKVTGGPT